jgi:hypothetical protein
VDDRLQKLAAWTNRMAALVDRSPSERSTYLELTRLALEVQIAEIDRVAVKLAGAIASESVRLSRDRASLVQTREHARVQTLVGRLRAHLDAIAEGDAD